MGGHSNPGSTVLRKRVPSVPLVGECFLSSFCTSCCNYFFIVGGRERPDLLGGKTDQNQFVVYRQYF